MYIVKYVQFIVTNMLVDRRYRKIFTNVLQYSFWEDSTYQGSSWPNLDFMKNIINNSLEQHESAHA